MEVAKKIRSNKEQIKYLCQYMAENVEFAAGDYRGPQGALRMAEEWARLKAALDELGPSKTVEQWKICWRDQKRKARTEGAARNRAVNQTGNSGVVPELSDNSVIVLSAIGPEMATGMGPDEAPIGFDPAVDEELAHQEQEQGQIDEPASPPRQRALRRRVRARATPTNQFLSAQLELNSLMKELISEVRIANELRREHISLL